MLDPRKQVGLAGPALTSRLSIFVRLPGLGGPQPAGPGPDSSILRKLRRGSCPPTPCHLRTAGCKLEGAWAGESLTRMRVCGKVQVLSSHVHTYLFCFLYKMYSGAGLPGEGRRCWLSSPPRGLSAAATHCSVNYTVPLVQLCLLTQTGGKCAFLLRHGFGCSVGLGLADTSSFSTESLKATLVGSWVSWLYFMSSLVDTVPCVDCLSGQLPQLAHLGIHLLCVH